MDKETSDREQRIIEGLYIVVAQELAEGADREQIVSRLVSEFRISPEKARFIIEDAEKEFAGYLEQYSINNPEYAKGETRKKDLQKMAYGLICAIGGIFLIFSVYSEGAVSIFSGIAALAALIFGIVYFSIGFKGWLKNRK